MAGDEDRKRQEEFLLQSTVTLEQLWEQKKEQLSQETKEELPTLGWSEEGLRIFSVYFWHSEGWTSRNEALLEKNSDHEASMADTV